MKYFITVQFQVFDKGIFSGPTTSEKTHIVTPDKLQEVLESLAREKQTVLRIVKGIELDFKQGIQIIEDEAQQ